jgi:telomere length regulation protein
VFRKVAEILSIANVAQTQMLLLSLARMKPQNLKMLSEMPIYHEGLSNRLSTSLNRARFLGMVVGEAVSAKVDPDERRLRFKVPETEDPSAEPWRSLIDLDDELYPLSSLNTGVVEEVTEVPILKKDQNTPAEEIVTDDNEDLDKDLRRYPVPDSDAEDSDDDPTLVSREKTKAPL